MIISCPGCKKRFKLDSNPQPKNVRLRCTACGLIFEVAAESGKGNGDTPQSACKVLLATDDAGIMKAIEGMLKGQDISVMKSGNSKDILDIAKNFRPHAVILDVALPGLYDFSICEQMKNTAQMKNVKIILLSEAFNKKRYRRKPTSLFGADDYVEKHDIQTGLLPKIWQLTGEFLINTQEPPKSEKACHARAEGKGGKTSVPDKTDIHERSRWLARVIAADIILYNKEKLDATHDNADVNEIFKNEIDEGVNYFRKRLPQAASARNYLNEAIREFIRKK